MEARGDTRRKTSFSRVDTVRSEIFHVFSLVIAQLANPSPFRSLEDRNETHLIRQVFNLCSGCAVERLLFDGISLEQEIRDLCKKHLPLIPIRKAVLDELFFEDSNGGYWNALAEITLVMPQLEALCVTSQYDRIAGHTLEAWEKIGVAKLALVGMCRIAERTLLDCCFSKSPINGCARTRTIYCDVVDMSPDFLQRVTEESVLFRDKHDGLEVFLQRLPIPASH